MYFLLPPSKPQSIEKEHIYTYINICVYIYTYIYIYIYTYIYIYNPGVFSPEFAEDPLDVHRSLPYYRPLVGESVVGGPVKFGILG